MVVFRERWVRRLIGGVCVSFVFMLLWCGSNARAAITHAFTDRFLGFSGIVELAVFAGGLYVADHRRGRMTRLNKATGAALAFSCNTAECQKYIEGDELTGTPAGPFSAVAGVAVDDATGEIYVSARDEVDVFASSGEFLGAISEVPASSGAAVTGPFVETAGLAFDQASGELYVADERTASDTIDLFKAEPGGATFTRELGEEGALSDHGENHQSIAISETGLLAGTVYVSDATSSEDFVDVFGALGLEASWTGAQTAARSFGIQKIGVGIDPVTGHVFVLDGGHGVVDEMPGSVSEEEALGRLKGTPEGQFTDPSAAAVDPETEDLYVGDEGVVDVFGPDVSLPNVVSEPPSPVGTTSATFNGTVSTKGETEAATCAFAWGTTSALGQSAACEPPGVPGESELPEHANVSLLPDTTYFYRLEATNGNGTNTGEESPPIEFTTGGPGIAGESVAEITSSSVKLNAAVNPHNGVGSVSHGARESYYFQYGTGSCQTAGACASVPAPPGATLGEGETPVDVEQSVQGLAPGTVYHYRVLALSEPSPGEVETFAGTEQIFTTQGSGVFGLPDGREWEMVSPPAKEGALVQPPGEPWGVAQAAAQGSAMTWVANVPTERGVVGYSNAQQVLSTRAPGGGWSSVDLASPHNGAVGLSDESGQEYRFFSEDLSEGILQPLGPFQSCHDSQGEPEPCFTPGASEQTAFARDLTTGLYTPLVTGCPGNGQPCEPAVAEHANVPEGTVFGQIGHQEGLPCLPEKFCGPLFTGASPDGHHVVIHSLSALKSPPSPEECTGGLYEWNASAPPAEQVQSVSMLPENGGFVCHASLGTRRPVTFDGQDARHAVSDDGSRVFWTAESGGLYMRDVPRGETIAIGGSGAEFQTASSDGSRVFFTVGGSLFECEVPEAPVCSPVLLGEAPAGGGQVIGASEDGAYVYWVAGNQDLYMDHDVGGVWERSVVAALSGEDGPDWANGSGAPKIQELTARVSPDGEWLAFMSNRDLAGYDNEDAFEGETEPFKTGSDEKIKTVGPYADEEVYLYHAPAGEGETGKLACASCNPSGARPVGSEVGFEGHTVGIVDNTNYQGWREREGGPGHRVSWLSGDIPGWVSFESTVARYQPRYLSNDGRLFFDSDSALVPKDIDGTWDVYEYEPVGVGGCEPSAGSGSVVFKSAHEYEVEGRSGEEGAGCVGLISSGESGQESVFLDASESGGDVFFMTTSQLAAGDFDHGYDIYDAHECSGGSPCPAPVAGSSVGSCVSAEACRAAPTPQPSIFGAPASSTFSGFGNVTSVPPVKPVVKVLSRAEKLAAALKACHKDKSKKKRKACEGSARKKYGAKAKAKSKSHKSSK
jgi:WD40-like Beta Propeller Repeat